MFRPDKNYPHFRPNVPPKEVFKKGAFGGTYYRPIYSSVTKREYDGKRVISEFPKSWFQGLDINREVISKEYNKAVNKYGVKCGSSLEDWEKNDWIVKEDPYGWFQWYCRFYKGRRMYDDERQIKRWMKLAGPKGRFRIRLMNQIIKAGKKYNDESISPVIRQVLLHWGYELTKKDFDRYKRSKTRRSRRRKK